MLTISNDEHKKLMLEMIVYLKDVCQENNLEFFLDGGTLIGLIRHQGYIPWDDDFDICMKREDYDKLCELLSKTTPYRIITHRNTTNYSHFFAKLVDVRTQAINPAISDSDDLGVFIDIFPLDKTPKCKIKKFFYFNSIWYLRKIAIFTYLNQVDKKSVLYVPWLFLRNLNREKIIEITNTIATKYNQTDSEDLTNILESFEKYLTIPSDYFIATTNFDFEGISLPAPIGYDSYLRSIYGDYMQFPPKEQQVGHHDYKLLWRE